jgi:hypothetical protein
MVSNPNTEDRVESKEQHEPKASHPKISSIFFRSGVQFFASKAQNFGGFSAALALGL